MNCFKRLFSRIATIAQFKIRLGDILLLEHLIASFILSVASVGILLLVSGSLFWVIGFSDLFSQNISYLIAFTWWTVMRLTILAVPLFLFARLVLVFKKEGLIAFFGALIGELIIIVPFLGFLVFSYAMWQTF